MNDNPYASPKTSWEPPVSTSRGVPWSKMNHVQRLILVGGWLTAGSVMVGSCAIMMSVCERMERWLGPAGSSQLAQWLYGIPILGVPLLTGKAVAIIYRRQCERIAQEREKSDPHL